MLRTIVKNINEMGTKSEDDAFEILSKQLEMHSESLDVENLK